MKKLLLLGAMVLGFGLAPEVSAQTGSQRSSIVYFEDNLNGRNDTTALRQRGYVTRFNGTGTQQLPAWLQGDPLMFESYNGPDSGYVASNHQVLTGLNQLDSWLILPALNVTAGDSLGFYSRSPWDSTHPDTLVVMYSASGNTGSLTNGWVELGRFKTDTTNNWVRMAFQAPTSGTAARFAIRHKLISGGPLGLNSDYVGIDRITVADGVLAATEEELGNRAISLYPNPATDRLWVVTTSGTGALTISNALGQEVQRQPITDKQLLLNVEHLAPGIYFVRMQTEKGIATQRFIKR